jgi:hypothetical protein
MAHPIHDLPEGYAEIRQVVLTEPLLLLRLNLLSLIPLAAMIVWMALWWSLVSRSRLPEPQVDIHWLIALPVVFLIILPLHELMHGLTIRLFGHNVRYGAKLSKGVFYATADSALFRRNEYIAVAVVPFVFITLLVMGLMFVLPQWVAYYAAIAAVFNAGGAVGDLWSVGVVLGYPASALIRDEADSFRIYAPLSAAGSSTQKREPPSAG